MLKQLSIRNIVLIAEAEILFAEGLCVLSGETGAGKSILLDALGLVLGARGDSGLVRAGEKQASVTALCDADNPEIALVLDELGIEMDNELVLRRTMSADGKGRCFVNDTPVSVGALRAIGERLVEIHGQHEQSSLREPTAHRAMLDAFAGHGAEVQKVGQHFTAWSDAKAELAALEQSLKEALAQRDYWEHMASELRALAPQPDEEEALADTRTRMMQTEKLAETLQAAEDELYGARPVDGALRDAQRVLTRSTLVEAEKFVPVIEALDRSQAELEDVLTQLQQLRAECEYNPQELEQAESRLFALKAAARKYQVSVAELPELLAETEAKLQQVSNQDGNRTALEKAVREHREAYIGAAEKLSAKRTKAASKLAKQVMAELTPLKMGGTQFEVECVLQNEEQWSAQGMDQVRFMAATNAGATVVPIHKIASGGELSRFMLALKVALAESDHAPTMIFDEIDTGTGGAVADAIGARLKQLASHGQVLVVTHLPQVAARGNHHLFIEKETRHKQTFTRVEVLDEAARKEEIARMLAAAEVTQEARAAADKLLQAAS